MLGFGWFAAILGAIVRVLMANVNVNW